MAARRWLPVAAALVLLACLSGAAASSPPSAILSERDHCTAILVGKQASSDGSVMVAHTGACPAYELPDIAPVFEEFGWGENQAKSDIGGKKRIRKCAAILLAECVLSASPLG